ncbi:MAG: hypothetical protein QM485_01685, partial [Flavobacteriaceae bacterium]
AFGDLTGVPADLADGDDDTTYAAGTGLDLAGTTFSVDNTDIAPEWANITGVPANLDTDSTDDFSGAFGDLTGVPADLADGDDDTTYAAGTGLDLTGTTFSVDNTDIAPEWANITGVPANLDTDSTDDFSGAFGDLTGVPVNLDTDSTDDFNITFAVATGNLTITDSNGSLSVPLTSLDSELTQVVTTGHTIATHTSVSGTLTNILETTTTLSQNTSTGVITYTNENSATQTANTVGVETNNDISVGTNGGALYVSPIKAFGKIGSSGSVTRATSGITVTKLSGNGHYRVNLPSGMVSDDNYIIQLTQPGRGGAGNDDPGISYSNQTLTGFDVIIGDNDNGGTDRSRFNSDFMFTVLDL